jgi:ankyrin repeat protein
MEQGGDAGCVAYLLRKGAEVNLQDMRGLSPLHNAAFAGNLSSAQLLGTLRLVSLTSSKTKT